jgi:hypothetical protein
MGDVGAVATLLAEVFAWLTDPSKFAQLKLENKLEKLQDALKVALDNKALDAADIIYNELRRLSSTGS